MEPLSGVACLKRSARGEELGGGGGKRSLAAAQRESRFVPGSGIMPPHALTCAFLPSIMSRAFRCSIQLKNSPALFRLRPGLCASFFHSGFSSKAEFGRGCRSHVLHPCRRPRDGVLETHTGSCPFCDLPGEWCISGLAYVIRDSAKPLACPRISYWAKSHLLPLTTGGPEVENSGSEGKSLLRYFGPITWIC